MYKYKITRRQAYQVSLTCALPKKNSPFERISHHYEEGQILRNAQDAQMQIAGF